MRILGTLSEHTRTEKRDGDGAQFLVGPLTPSLAYCSTKFAVFLLIFDFFVEIGRERKASAMAFVSSDVATAAFAVVLPLELLAALPPAPAL